MKDLHVVVVGAGMGGLALGLALKKAGISFTLYEQAPELSEVGAGIMMTPNASRTAMSLGTFDAIDAQAQRPAATFYRDFRTGEVISTMAYDEAFQKHFDGPYLTLHRADLQLALRDTLLQYAPGTLKLNHMLVDVENHANKAVAVFANGETAEGDLLVACDGVRSTIRTKVFGIDAPTYSGNIAYRGMVPIERLGPLFHTVNTFTSVGIGQHLVNYTVKKGTFVNYVAITEKEQWTAEGWSEHSSREEVAADFKGWHKDFHSMFEATPDDGVYKWGLFDREPLKRWVNGRVALLGDAAHPTTPFMAQGAAMSFEDAVVLGRALEQGNTLEEGLDLYEAARVERGAFVVLRSRFFGQLYHKQVPGDEIGLERRKANEVLYSYDAATVPLKKLSASR